MSNYKSTKIFWYIFLAVGILFLLIPINNKDKEPEIEQVDIDDDYEGEVNKIYFISNGLLNSSKSLEEAEFLEDLEAYDEDRPTYLDIAEKQGFRVKHFEMNFVDMESIASSLSYIKTGNKFCAYVLNIGIGDYYHSYGIYSNEASSFYDALVNAYSRMRYVSPDAKIIFITDKYIKEFEEKNELGYTYEDYYNILVDFANKHEDIELIDFYQETKDTYDENKTQEEQLNIILPLASTDEQDVELINRVINIINETSPE